MTIIHTVTVETDDEGTAYHWSFACSGDASSECHQWCAEGCEETCTAFYGDGGNRHRWEPMPPHGESCRIVDWLDNTDVWDSYDDCGDGTPPNRPGRIEDEWTGDAYIWRYWDLSAAEATTP